MKESKKKRRLDVVIPIPVWDAEVEIRTAKDFNKFCDKYGIPNRDRDANEYVALHMCGKHKGKWKRYILLRPGFDDGILIHEIIHAAYNVLEDKGTVITFENQEPLTYLVEYIFNQAVKYERENKKPYLH